VVNAPEEVDAAHKELEQLIEAARMDVAVETIIFEDSIPNMLSRYSGSSTVIFLGLNIDANTEPLQFQENYTNLLRGLPTTIMIQSTGEADLLS
jgi:hypothetical protein